MYEQVEARAGFTAEAKAVYERGVLSMMTMMTKENEAPQKDRGPATVVDPSATRGGIRNTGIHQIRDQTYTWCLVSD